MRRRERDAPSMAAALIKEARRKKRLTQAQLASLASVSQQTVSRIERGESDPGLRQLNGILRPAGFELKVHLTTFEEFPILEVDVREKMARSIEADAEARVRVR